MTSATGAQSFSVSRRNLLRLAGVASLSLSSGALLAACGGGTTTPVATSAGATTTSGGVAAPTAGAGSAVTVAPSPANSPAGQTSRSSGKQVEQFAVDLPGDVASLDPGTQYDTNSYAVYGNIFDTLLTRDPKTAEIKPYLATSYKIVNDTTWEFKLRDGIKFHNGEPFDANTVKFSIERILSPDLKSPQRANYSLVDHVEVVDPLTARVITKQPFPVLPSYLATHRVVPPKYAQDKGADFLAANPVGTGPYKFVEWAKGDHVALEANPNYWNGTPPAKKVIFRPVSEASTRIADLIAGRSDFIFGVTPDDIERIKGNANLTVFSTPTERIAYLMMQTLDTFDSPTKDPKVREAISYAIDRNSLLTILLKGHGKLTNEMLSPQHVGYDPAIAPYTFDQKKAKALMQEAGVGNGFKLQFLTSPTYDVGNLVVQALQEMLGQIGIKLDISSIEWSLYLKKIQNKDWQDIRFGQWSCSCLDADGVLYPLYDSESGWSAYSNPEMDKALQAGKTTLDSAARKDAYRMALNIGRELTPILPLWQVEAIYAGKNSIKWQPTVDEQFYLMDFQL